MSSREPVAPARWRRGLAPDLEAVCLKCLAKEPGQRYSSAQALADDLGRWLEGRPTLARPLGRLGRWRKTVRRHPRVSVALAVVLGLVLATPVLWYETRSERIVEQYEAQLARGEPVALIGDNGGPRWSRWCMGEDGGQTFTSDDGFFSVHPRSLGLLELMPAIRLDRYRIRAEVRHERDAGNLTDEVGIFVGHHEIAVGPGTLHFYEHLAFNGVSNAKREWLQHRAINNAPPESEPPGNRVELIHRIVGWQIPDFDRDIRVYAFQAATFEPTAHKAWRTLTLTVTPEKIRATWENQSAEESLESLLQDLHEDLTEPRYPLLDTQLLPRLDSSWVRHGSLGLCVIHGIASFRRVVIEPLENVGQDAGNPASRAGR